MLALHVRLTGTGIPDQEQRDCLSLVGLAERCAVYPLLIGLVCAGVSIVPGYGVTGGAGVEWRLTEALGLAAAGRYQWIRFLQEFSSRRTFEGFGAELGVTYRFQYR